MSLFVISFESDIISYWILLINELNNIIDMCSFYICMRVMLLPFKKKLFFISFRDLPPMYPVDSPDRARKIVLPETDIPWAAETVVCQFLTK